MRLDAQSTLSVFERLRPLRLFLTAPGTSFLPWESLARLRHAVMSAPCRLSGVNRTRCAHFEISRS
jgi:hypothetical protein